jgi:hypothetical protein
MVIDLTKNNSTASIKNIDEDIALQYYKKLNLDHSSPSQEALSDSEFLVRYCLFTQEDRRLLNGSSKMNAGVSIGRASQRYLSKYMFEAEKKLLNEKKSIDQIIDEELKLYDQYQPHNQLDKEEHEDTKNYLVDMIKITCNSLKELDLGNEVASERYCTYKFDGLALEKIGRLDFEQLDKTGKNGKIVELKTKHRSKRKSSNKNGFTWTKGYLPKETPDINHIRQCAFYWKATGGKVPHLLYVNQDSHVLFTAENCDLLTPEYMEFIIQQDLIKAKIRQNLIVMCKGNPYEMAKLIPPPDFSSYMWKNVQQEYVLKAASLWDNI